MAGHILRDSFMPVDYKEGEHSNLVLSEFHHIVDAAFFIYFPMIFYFSGTGNSRWVARQLSKSLTDTLISIPVAFQEGKVTYELAEGESVGFVFPVYSWGPPPLVLSFLEQLSLRYDCQPYLYFVCTCGDDTGWTRQVFQKALARKGWTCHAGFSVTMPNTYVLLPGFDVDTPEVEERKLSAADSRLSEITRLLMQQAEVFDCFEGAFPFLKTRIIRPLFHRFHMSPQHFTVTSACVGCGACQKACPLHNVTLLNRKPVWGMDCAACLACYHTCPQQAIQYGTRTQGKGQYYHP